MTKVPNPPPPEPRRSFAELADEYFKLLRRGIWTQSEARQEQERIRREMIDRYWEESMVIRPGDRVRDRITGYEGIAICRMEWLYGCVRFLVQAEALGQDGKPVPSETFDEPQLEYLGVGEPARAGENEPPGGIRSDPPQRPDPLRR